MRAPRPLLGERLLVASAFLWVPFFALSLIVSENAVQLWTWTVVRAILFLAEFALMNLAALVSLGVLDKVFGTSESLFSLSSSLPSADSERFRRRRLARMTVLMYAFMFLVFAFTWSGLHLNGALIWAANGIVIGAFVFAGLRLSRRALALEGKR